MQRIVVTEYEAVGCVGGIVTVWSLPYSGEYKSSSHVTIFH